MFTTTAARIFAGLAITGTALLGSAGVAAADAQIPTTPTDATYLSIIDQQGIDFPSDSQAIALAHNICSEFDNGSSFDSIVQEGRDNSELSDYNIGFVIGAAVHVYCPENSSDLPSN